MMDPEISNNEIDLLLEAINRLYDFRNYARASLKRRIGVFGEMNLIVCRNVLIYFNKVLQNQVLHLFMESLGRGGLLCLGNKETLDFTEVVDHFEVLSKSNRIYKKLESASLFTKQLSRV